MAYTSGLSMDQLSQFASANPAFEQGPDTEGPTTVCTKTFSLIPWSIAVPAKRLPLSGRSSCMALEVLQWFLSQATKRREEGQPLPIFFDSRNVTQVSE